MKKNKKIKKKREGEKKKNGQKKERTSGKETRKRTVGEGGKKVEKRCTWVGRDEKKEEGIR